MSEVLTSLRFIEEHCKFPPSVCVDRFNLYDYNDERFNGVYNNGRKLSVMTPEGLVTYDWAIMSQNYYELVTNKLIGLVLNDYPSIKLDGDIDSKTVVDLLEDSGFYANLSVLLKNYSVYGDGVIEVYTDSEGNPCTNVINPMLWFKVVDSKNISKVKNHVLYQPLYEEYFEAGEYSNRLTHCKVIVHYKGYFEEKVYTYLGGEALGNNVEYMEDDGTIIPLGGRIIETGLNDFAIYSIHNRMPLGDVYGVSDYRKIVDIVEELEKRYTLLSALIDKHQEPLLLAPTDLFVQDEKTGEMVFKAIGNKIPIRPNLNGGTTFEPKYVEWDGKTENTERLIKDLKDDLATITEFGKVYLYGEYSNASGESLKTQLKGALDLGKRVSKSVNSPIKDVIKAIAYLGGIVLKSNQITIEWETGIAESEFIQSQTIKNRVESGTMSRKRVIQLYDGLNEEQADIEVEAIKKERGDLSNGDIEEDVGVGEVRGIKKFIRRKTR